jgi:hypothetical protein
VKAVANELDGLSFQMQPPLMTGKTFWLNTFSLIRKVWFNAPPPLRVATRWGALDAVETGFAASLAKTWY